MIIVAASNASAQSKTIASFTCGGASDQKVINQAIAALPAGVGGRVLLTEGSFKIDGPIVIDSDYVTIEGAGYGSYIYPQSPSVSMPAMIQIGATRNVSRVSVRSLRLYGGRDQGMASGNAIDVNGNNTDVRDIYIRQAAGNGIVLGSINSSNVFEQYLDNVYVQAPANDGIVMEQTVSDSELVRCIVVGGQQPVSETSMTLQPGAFGRHGFNLMGTNLKLTFCHAYFCLWSIYSTSWGMQVVGGEYETNVTGGIYQGNRSPDGLIMGALFYDNPGDCIKLDTSVSNHRIIGNSFVPGPRNGLPANAIELNGAVNNVVSSNVIYDVASGGNAIYAHGNASGNTIVGNSISPGGASPTGNGGNAVTLYDSATLNQVIANTLAGSVQERPGGAGTPSFNCIEDNTTVYGGAGVTLIGRGSAEDPINVPWQPGDNNLLLGSWDPALSPANTQLTAGVLYLVRLGARDDALTVSRLWWNVFTAGAGASRGTFTGLYDSTGALVASSADIGSSLAAAGPVAATLRTPYAMSRGQFVWAAIVCNLATTQPSLSKGTGGQTLAEIGNVPVTQARFATNGSGLTALPATITPSHNIFTAQTLWAGAS